MKNLLGPSLIVLASVLVSPALAQAPDVNSPSPAVEEIVVFGRGQARQVQVVRGTDILTKTPGASPLKLVEQLPGVFFSSADAFGNYEYSTTLSIRGFNQNQLGYTLDSVPLGDMSYSNHNGLHISRALISENIDQVQLAQGSGDLEVASTSNLGGSLQYMSRQPSLERGLETNLSVGSDQYRRASVRLDSGELAGFGGRASLAFADSNSNKWKGPGEQKLRQVNLKYLQPVGQGTVTLWLNGSQRRENDYLEHSKEQMARLGHKADYLAPNYALAIKLADIAHNRGDTGLDPTNPAAGTDFPSPYTSVDDGYFQGAGLRDDVIGAATWKTPIGENTSSSLTLYGHANRGQGPWFTPYVQSPNALDPTATKDNAPIAFRGFSYKFARSGLVWDITHRMGQHTLKAGVWFERNLSTEGYRYYGLDRDKPSRDSLKFQSRPFLTDNLVHFETNTSKFYVSDSIKLNPDLTLNIGFKGQKVASTSATRILDNAKPAQDDPYNIRGRIESTDGFLPQVGFVWRPLDKHELFGDYSESQAAFAAQVDGVIANGTQAVVDDAVARLKPETSKTFEFGWRWYNDKIETVVAAYRAEFSDRLLQFSASSSPILQSESIYRNVGSVRSIGIEATIKAELTPTLSALASYTRNNSTYRSDVRDDDGNVSMRTSGKQVAGSPRDLFKADLTYDDGQVFAGLSYAYTGRNYYTYENDNPIAAYDLVDLNMGYRWQAEGPLKDTEISLNVSNLLDKKYISAFTGNVPNDPDGTAQVLLSGSPRTVFVSLRHKF